MKAVINRPGCIACGQCAEICPEIFVMADDGLADIIKNPVPATSEAEAAEARDSCPVSVISLET